MFLMNRKVLCVITILMFVISIIVFVYYPVNLEYYHSLKKQVDDERRILNLYHQNSLEQENLIYDIYHSLSIRGELINFPNYLKQLRKYIVYLRNFSIDVPFSNPVFKIPIYISSYFGFRFDPVTQQKAFHTGVDIISPLGGKVLSVANGLVQKNAYNQDYGYYIMIKHRYGFSTVYAHLLNRSIFKVGSYVQKGDIVGFIGMSGRSTGPHLHYEILSQGVYQDPVKYLLIARNLRLF